MHYAFECLDESGDDALTFAEYRANRASFMKILHFNCALRKPALTVREEFDEMASYNSEEDAKRFLISKGTLALGETHVDETFLTFKSTAEWYRYGSLSFLSRRVFVE